MGAPDTVLALQDPNELSRPADLCLQLKTLGFPQKRQFQAMYYIQPDMLICIDDLSALKSDGKTDFEDIFSRLVFKPTLEDINIESRLFFDQLRWTVQSGVFAYSNIQIATPSELNPDTYIRAGAEDEWTARVKLWILVKQWQNTQTPPRTLDETTVAASENQVPGTEANT